MIKKKLKKSTKRFENMLDTIQKKNNAEKENIINDKNITITNMEQKYQKEIKEIIIILIIIILRSKIKIFNLIKIIQLIQIWF